MEEIGRKIDGNENYSISTLGRLRNDRSGRIRKTYIDPEGYMRVVISKTVDKKRHYKCVYIHQEVARTFIDNPLGLPETDHINENKLDNRVDNLRGVTRRENHAHSHSTGGRKKPIPVAQYTMDDQLVGVYPSIYKASKITGVCTASIYKCATGMRFRKSAGGFQWRLIGDGETK